MQLLTAEQLVSSRLARLGIYGDNGTGKTTLLASIAEKNGRGMVVSADQENVKPLLDHPWVTVAKIDKWDDLTSIHVMLQKDAGRTIKWVGFDTETRNQALAGLKLTGQVIKPEDTVKWLASPIKGGKGFDYWDSVGALCAEHVRQTCLLPLHVIFLFQEMEREPKYEHGVYEIGPALTPKAYREVKSALEIVGRLYVEVNEGGAGDGEITINLDAVTDGPQAIRRINPNMQETRRLLIGKHELYFAKGPTHKLGYTVENPTWEALSPAWS